MMKTIFVFLVLVQSLSFANLINNSNLNTPLSPWLLRTFEGAQADFISLDENGVMARVAVLQPGAERWNIQLSQNQIDLNQGNRYEVLFKASASLTRTINVRVGMDESPYSAYGEFHSILLTPVTQSFRYEFVMPSNDENARLEFNLGQYTGDVFLTEIQLNCMDCEGGNSSEELSSSQGLSSSSFSYGNASGNENPFLDERLLNYLVVAEGRLELRTSSGLLGGTVSAYEALNTQTDVRIYGDVQNAGNCFFSERTLIDGTLEHTQTCSEQNNVVIGTDVQVAPQLPVLEAWSLHSGNQDQIYEPGQTVNLAPGAWGRVELKANSVLNLSSGEYNLQSLKMEPDGVIHADLTDGPLVLNIVDGVHLADRFQMQLLNGSSDEVHWNVQGGSVNIGTNAKVYGNFYAKHSDIYLANYTAVVGSLFGHNVELATEAYVCKEPVVEEINHSQYNFAPFFHPHTYRYFSPLPLETESLEFFIYGGANATEVVGYSSSIIPLESNEQVVKIRVNRDLPQGFPLECGSAEYNFHLKKQAEHRIYANAESACTEDCDGSSPIKAVKTIAEAVDIASVSGKTIKLLPGRFNLALNTDGRTDLELVPGLEIVGMEVGAEGIWQESTEGIPQINFQNLGHIEITGKSPRELIGLQLLAGRAEYGGAVSAPNSQKIIVRNTGVFNSAAAFKGGGFYFPSTFEVELERVSFFNNGSGNEGGALWTQGMLKASDVVFSENIAQGAGGALYSMGWVYITKGIFSNNQSLAGAGAYVQGANSIFLNCTFFQNVAQGGNHAIEAHGFGGGYVTNSVFWKNHPSTCSDADCKTEVSQQFTTYSSSFSAPRSGTGNISGDPLFVNEAKPGGDYWFLAFDSGLRPQQNSPLHGHGALIENYTPEMDYIGLAYGPEGMDIGAYAWVDESPEMIYGQWFGGEFREITPKRPVFEKFYNKRQIKFAAYGKSGRIIKTLVKKHSETNVNSAWAKVSLLNVDGVPYTDVPSVKIRFFKVGEEGGNYVFMTLKKGTGDDDYEPDKHGKPLLFSLDVNDVGDHGVAYILHVKNAGDRLQYELVE
jgi:hypothetical protein